MSRIQISKLKDEFLKLGGSQEFLDGLPKTYSIEVEAKLRYELRKLKTIQREEPVSKSKKITQTPSINSNPEFEDLISDYPVELHSVYLERKQKFLSACSLKIRLNYLPAEDVESAFNIQCKIWNLFSEVDRASEKLAYWREHKRILKNETVSDFSNLTGAELVQRRNTLRSNATNRSKTILKLEQQLSESAGSKKVRIADKLFKKREELRKIENDIETLERMIRQ